MTSKLVLSAAFAAVLAGCATHPVATTAEAAKPPAGCVPDHTASRLPADDSTCAAFGRTYTGEEMRRTGYTNVGQALRNLDPSITTNGGH